MQRELFSSLFVCKVGKPGNVVSMKTLYHGLLLNLSFLSESVSLYSEVRAVTRHFDLRRRLEEMEKDLSSACVFRSTPLFLHRLSHLGAHQKKILETNLSC